MCDLKFMPTSRYLSIWIGYDKTIDEHDNEGEIITCNICEKTFQTQRKLNSEQVTQA